MKTILTNNSILSKHYVNYLKMLADNNNKLISTNLSDLEISQLYDSKYQLTEFDIYKYITAYDYITESLGCNKYTLTEGITENKFIYNNILIDLFYKNIPLDTLLLKSISSLFENIEIEWDESVEIWDDDDNINYILNNTSQNYTGNTFTFYVFKQLVKLFLTEVYLYKYNNKILTHKELESEYSSSLYDGGYLKYKNKDPDSIPETIPMSQWMIENKITKVKYGCIKVMDPHNLNSATILDLKLYLVDISKFRDFSDTYETLIKKKI